MGAVTIADTMADERIAQFSPDGRWVVMESNESGRFEVYVQPFPGPAVKVLIFMQSASIQSCAHATPRAG
jgi:Tol biopolymer transport system component